MKSEGRVMAQKLNGVTNGGHGQSGEVDVK